MTYPEGERDVQDLGQRHFLRPFHDLAVPRDHPSITNPASYAGGDPILASAATPIKGLQIWHDCKAQESSWHTIPLEGDVIECPIAGCGDRGRIVDGAWQAA